jgi:hypothetical protein
MTSTKLKFIVGLVIAVVLLGATLFPRSGAAEQPAVAVQAAANPVPPQKAVPRKPSVILLWMSGGPSQMDTFDLKPGHPNGGPFREIDTNVKGIRISEHLPKLARQMNEMVLIRVAVYCIRAEAAPSCSLQMDRWRRMECESRRFGGRGAGSPAVSPLERRRDWHPQRVAPRLASPTHAAAA